MSSQGQTLENNCLVIRYFWYFSSSCFKKKYFLHSLHLHLGGSVLFCSAQQEVMQWKTIPQSRNPHSGVSFARRSSLWVQLRGSKCYPHHAKPQEHKLWGLFPRSYLGYGFLCRAPCHESCARRDPSLEKPVCAVRGAWDAFLVCSVSRGGLCLLLCSHSVLLLPYGKPTLQPESLGRVFYGSICWHA